MYTPNLYTDEDIDQGVALAGGGYRVQWGEYGNSYWKTPTPPDIYYKYHYVLNWDTSNGALKVAVNELVNWVRSGSYLQKTFALLEAGIARVAVSTVPIIIPGDTIAIDWYLVSIDGVNTANPDLETAQWQAIGIWGMRNLYPTSNAGYMKVMSDSFDDPALFMIDENTYLIP